jgi:hypothetical protein
MLAALSKSSLMKMLPSGQSSLAAALKKSLTLTSASSTESIRKLFSDVTANLFSVCYNNTVNPKQPQKP